MLYIIFLYVYTQTSTLQFITGDQGTRQYADEGDEIIAHQLNAEPQRSFDNLGSSSSDSGDDTFLNEAPPQYYDVVIEPPVLSEETRQMTLQVSTDHTDAPVPAQAISEPYQPPQPQRQVQFSSRSSVSIS